MVWACAEGGQEVGDGAARQEGKRKTTEKI